MSDAPRFEAGAVLVLAEQDYCYGTGELTLRIESCGAEPSSFPRLEWVRICGQELHWDGTEKPTEVLVRVSAIDRSLRPPDTRPPRDSNA